MPPRFPLHPDTLALTATLALMTALGPLSTDLYLPSLPAIAQAFGTGPSRVQLTLSAFLIGFAAGQIVYGPLSDRLGRKPVLLAGLGLFLLGSAACALAPTVEALIAARAVQALGAAGPIVLARAMVRDLYEGPRAGRELSRMGTIMGLVPALAPVLGGLIEIAAGWRYAFLAMLFYGMALLAHVAWRLPETLARRDPSPLTPGAILAGFSGLMRVASYRAHVAIAALAYGGLFAFISASSFVLQGVYGLSELAFAAAFALMVAGYIAGTLLASRFAGRWGMAGLVRGGGAALAAGGVLMTAGVAAALPTSFAVTLPMALYALGVGLALPQAQAAAMAPFPERAGAASSLLGLCQMLLAAAVGTLVGHGLGESGLGGSGLGVSAWPLAVAVLVTGVLAAGIAWRGVAVPRS